MIYHVIYIILLRLNTAEMWNFWHIKEQGEFSKECVCCLLQKANTFKCHGQTDRQTDEHDRSELSL